MKRFISVLACVMLAVVTAVSLCACSTFGSVKKAYEKEGYEEVEVSDEAKKQYENSEDYKKIKDVVTIHIFKKGLLEWAIIAEFKSTKEMEEALKEHVTAEDAKNIYDELQKQPYISGNCMLLNYLLITPGAYEIFKSTK